jgi:spoIIIJ-associated protein
MPSEDTLALAKLRLEEMLTFFGINTTVKVSEENERIHLSVDTSANGRLIGRQGENLRALQHLINAIVRGKTEETVYINVDVADYRKGRAELLTAKANEYAQKVIDSGEELRLRPMSASDRRIIHMTLAEHPEVMTESQGEGVRRHLVVKKRKV